MNKYDHGLIHWHWKKMSASEFCNKPIKKMQSFWGDYIYRCANKYCSKNQCEDSLEIDKRESFVPFDVGRGFEMGFC